MSHNPMGLHSLLQGHLYLTLITKDPVSQSSIRWVSENDFYKVYDKNLSIKTNHLQHVELTEVSVH
jgi:hypothetical protein